MSGESGSVPKIYLLPGLDGTGDLFAHLVALLPANSARVVSYPLDHPASWEALVSAVASQVDTRSPFVLFAESFSGPVAIRFLSKHGARCVGFLACATFLSNPAPFLLRLATLPGVRALVPRRPPGWAVRRLLLSRNATDELVEQVAETIGRVPRRTVFRRLGLIRSLSAEAVDFDFPVVYVRGEEDRVVGPRLEAEFVAHVSECRVERVPGPHLLAQERPEAVARLLMLCASKR
jgi:pimeloyl-ACP methyl ester carboxylesterase